MGIAIADAEQLRNLAKVLVEYMRKVQEARDVVDGVLVETRKSWQDDLGADFEKRLKEDLLALANVAVAFEGYVPELEERAKAIDDYRRGG